MANMNENVETISTTELCERIAQTLRLSPTTVVSEIAKMIFEDAPPKYLGDDLWEFENPS